MKEHAPTTPTDDHPYSVPATHTEILPFRVRLAQTAEDIDKAVQLRATAYHRHVPQTGAELSRPEPDDFSDDAVLLVAESKLDRSVLGSVRLKTNRHMPLHFEHDAQLPSRFLGQPLVEARRLTIKNGNAGRMVSPALMKAIYEICFRCQIFAVLITARRPVDLMYRAMQFEDLLDGKKVCLSDVSNLPHGLYSLATREADSRWRAANWPLYPFFASTIHPDIQVDQQEVSRRLGAKVPSQALPGQMLQKVDGHESTHPPNCSATFAFDR